MKSILAASLLGVVLLTSGCTGRWKTNPIVNPRGSVEARRYYGNVGIEGNGNNVTMQAGSNVPRLSIFGHNNQVVVEDGCTLFEVEIVGDGNIVNLPARHVLVRAKIWGKSSVTYRGTTLSDLPTGYRPPPEYIVPADGTTTIIDDGATVLPRTGVAPTTPPTERQPVSPGVPPSNVRGEWPQKPVAPPPRTPPVDTEPRGTPPGGDTGTPPDDTITD
jgi:hypothetical protein